MWEQLFIENSDKTLIWVILTTVIGIISTVIGVLLSEPIKFLFTGILGPRLKLKWEARVQLETYLYPFVQAADSLDRQIDNFINNIDKGWYSEETEGGKYYRLNTLYLFGAYFGWNKILEKEAFLRYTSYSGREKSINRYINRVFKSLTGWQYFKKGSSGYLFPEEDLQDSSIYRRLIAAMGELMVMRKADKERLFEVIDFTEFVKKWKEDESFKSWFTALEQFLADQKPQAENANWNRLLVMGVNLKTLLNSFQKEMKIIKRRTDTEINNQLAKMHKEVRKNLEEELG